VLIANLKHLSLKFKLKIGGDKMKRIYNCIENLKKSIENTLDLEAKIGLHFYSTSSTSQKITPEIAQKVVDYFSKKYETKTKASIIEVGDNKSLIIKMYSYKHNIEVTFYIDIEDGSIRVENNEWSYTT